MIPGPLIPIELHESNTEQIADDLLVWLSEGMYDTSIRAGLMGELGTSSPIKPFEERQLRAAAMVQRQTGAYFDRSYEHEPRDIDRIECVLRLLEKGYGSQIMLAHDICTLIQFHHYVGWGWDHLLRNIVPRLRHEGVSQQELDVIFIETPRRLLTISA